MNDVLKGIRPSRQSAMDSPDDVWEIIESCWVHQPNDRVKIDTVVRKLKACQGPGKHDPQSPSHTAVDARPSDPDVGSRDSQKRIRSFVEREWTAMNGPEQIVR